VATYNTRRFTSIVGADQIALPDGSWSCVPALFFFVGFGGSMVKVCHSYLPVVAS
jgi:hypothetical protein